MTTITDRPRPSTEAFAERVFDSVLGTFDVFALYVGEKLGLYAALADNGPSTADELAEATGIHPRYAREWLEQQTVTGFLEVDDPDRDPAVRRFSLPDEFSPVLLDADHLDYLAPFVRLVLAGGQALPELLEAYRSGSGVSWAALGADARSGQGDMNRPWYLHSIGSQWFPAIPELDARLAAGGRVADIACGEGWSSIAIAEAYPDATVDGYDVDGPSIEMARRHAAEAGVADRVRFHHADVADLPEEDGYDAVVGFEFVHDLPDPVAVLSAMRRMAKPQAPVVVMDENVPDRFSGASDDVERTMYGFSLFICLPDGMSHQPSAGTGTVIRADTMRDYVRAAGFADIDIAPIDHDLWRFYRLVWPEE